MLEVVDNNERVIRLESRSNVHTHGLLHREIHIWFMTHDGYIVFQHRAHNKDIYPDKLDATVGGHVEPGMSPEETAYKECQEETGVILNPEKLIFLKKIQTHMVDITTNHINNAIDTQYVYPFNNDINELQTEEKEALGFELWDSKALPLLSKKDASRFIPAILSKEFLDIFQTARSRIVDV